MSINLNNVELNPLALFGGTMREFLRAIPYKKDGFVRSEFSATSLRRSKTTPYTYIKLGRPVHPKGYKIRPFGWRFEKRKLRYA